MQTPRPQPTFTLQAQTSADGRFYVGPVMYSTQPLPPPACIVIADNFAYPPPPVPEYYVGPAWFDVMGPPPMACCVAASKFEYPPPPVLEYYVSPPRFDVTGPQPMAYCVAPSTFTYPPQSPGHVTQRPWSSVIAPTGTTVRSAP